MTLSDDQQLPVATILVVEDDADTREFFVLLIGMAGYHVLEAASGTAALQTAAVHAVQGIILDLRLPDMDGLAVCRSLRANEYPDVPIILATADRTPDVTRRALEAGVTTMLEKPFAPEDLIERLRSVLQVQA